MYISLGEYQSVIVETDDNLIDLLQTEVVNNELKIGFNTYKHVSPTRCNIFITTTTLNSLKISGSGSIYGKNTIITDNFKTKISGSGTIELGLSAGTVQSIISGSGNITFTGKAYSYSISVSGSGNCSAINMETDISNVTIKGSGKCQVNANKNLDVVIKGSGSVQYTGNPQVNSKISGSGKLKSI